MPVRDCEKQGWVEEKLGFNAVVSEVSADLTGSAGAGIGFLNVLNLGKVAGSHPSVLTCHWKWDPLERACNLGQGSSL